MATVEEMKKQARGVTGRAAAKRFVAWSKRNDRDDMSEEAFQAWDMAHNYGAVRASFESDEDILRDGILLRYRRVLDLLKYEIRIKKARGVFTVRQQCIKTNEFGRRVLVEDAPEPTRAHWLEVFKRDIMLASAKARLFAEWDVIQQAAMEAINEQRDDGFALKSPVKVKKAA